MPSLTAQDWPAVLPIPKGAVVKPESQTRLSAVTAVEKDNQPASTPALREQGDYGTISTYSYALPRRWLPRQRCPSLKR